MAHVLVVDDEPDSLGFVVAYLRLRGHTVTTAENGERALHALLDDRPDAVVLDVRMPKMDGITLLEIARSYLRWHALPVVILTAHATAEQLQKAREMGVSHIFQKGKLELPDLAAAVDAATGATKAGRG